MDEEKLLVFKKSLLNGCNVKEAADKANIKYGSTYTIIKKYNLSTPNKNIRLIANGDYFNDIDTEKKAYILGFFIADGYIEKNSGRICFNNSIDDISVFREIQEEICPNSKLHYSTKQTGVNLRKKQVLLRFTNKNITKILDEKYDLTSGKTFNENYVFDFSKLSEDLIPHFIRGYFDGDGSVSYIPKTGKKQLLFNFSFVFNSELFANQFAEIFKNKFDIIPVIYSHIGKTCDYYSLRFNYNRIRKYKIELIYKWLYNDATIFLDRKKIKFEQYLNTEVNFRGNTL